MANNYFYQPVKVYCGEGKLNELSAICLEHGYKRGLLIIDKLFVNNGFADLLIQKCPLLVGVFSDITPNPRLSEVMQAANLLNALQADFAVAIGGGSALDLAKFACSMASAEYDIRDYFYKKRTFDKKGAALIAVPTTAGTGSEVTAVAVCNDEINGVKAPLLHTNFYPSIAVIDPILTLSVPPHITAATGLDALSHALEGYWSVNHNPISDALATESARLIFANLEKAYKYGNDIEARSNMSLAALLAGMAFATPKTAGVHACSYPLSENYGLSHGEACAFTLDSFIRLNATAEEGRVNRLATTLGFADADAMADEVLRLKRVTRMRCSLKAFGIEDIMGLAAASAAHPLMNNNPRKLTVDELIAMYKDIGNG
ncbi:MAG: iron-containing alcohol dehydrogenase [Clostridia bacterium]|nr:iron-containing alcohol dehydrogenase [Clostridia bacterium]